MSESMWAPSNRSRLTSTSSSSSTTTSSTTKSSSNVPLTKKPAPGSSTSTSGSSSHSSTKSLNPDENVKKSSTSPRSKEHDIPPHQSIALPSSSSSSSSSSHPAQPKTLGEQASAARAFAALHHAPPPPPLASVSHPGGHHRNGGEGGGVRSGNKRDRRAEKEELWKSIWGDDSEDEQPAGSGSASTQPGKTGSVKAGGGSSRSVGGGKEVGMVTENGVLVPSTTTAAKTAGEDESKPNKGIEDSMWAPKNRSTGIASGSTTTTSAPMKPASGKDSGVTTPTSPTFPNATTTTNTPDISAAHHNPPTEIVKPKAPEPIGRFAPTDLAEGQINWADDDEEDEAAGFMKDVMAQWGMTPGGSEGEKGEDEEEKEVVVEGDDKEEGVKPEGGKDDQVNPTIDVMPTIEEKKPVESVEKPAAVLTATAPSDKPTAVVKDGKPGKVSLSDRIDWDRQAAVGANNLQDWGGNKASAGMSSAMSGSWRSDERAGRGQHSNSDYHPHHGGGHGQSSGGDRGGRGGGRGGRGSHSRQQSYDGRSRRPTELLSLPTSPVTPASTAIVTPTPSTASTDEPARPKSSHQGHHHAAGEDGSSGPNAKRPARNERPRIALQDSSFKRMTRGLLGGQGGQGSTRSDRTMTRKEVPSKQLEVTQPAIATPTGIPEDFGGNDDGWSEVKSKGRSQRGRKRNV